MGLRDDSFGSPLVSNVTATLTERIRSGQYRDERGFPSERELVEEFGVSRTIIRQVLEALEQQDLVIRSPRCRTLVRDLGNSGTSPLAETRRSTLGLWIWPGPTTPGAAAVVQGICQALDHDTYRLVIGNAAWESWESMRQAEARFLEQMVADQDIVGILLWYLSGEENLPTLRKVCAAGIPMVFLDRQPPQGIQADYVGVDNTHAAEQVVRHLVAQGHRSIAHLTNLDPASTVTERLAGYRRALEAAGIPYRPELVVTATESSREAAPPVYDAMVEHLLKLPGPPTALFGVNDVTTDRFKEALWARGLRVPEDMALAGFDGLERWTTRKPFLTTALQPFERLGVRAVELLTRRIQAGPTAPYQHMLLEAPLSIHGSTQSVRRDEIPPK